VIESYLGTNDAAINRSGAQGKTPAEAEAEADAEPAPARRRTRRRTEASE
jgi:hypothetical protein